jgi:hypothetical protein
MTRNARVASLWAFAAVSLAVAAWGISALPELRSIVQRPSCGESARPMARLELLFGALRTGGAPVSDEEWAAFLDTEVTPRFPDGLTVVQGRGQWHRGDGRLIRERSNVLIIWHEPGSQTNSEIEAIRSAYKKQFEQESVMRVDSASCVSF